MRKRIFPQLDGLRGLAALVVVARHYWPGNFWDPTEGRIGVDFFFVLSGFLITRSLLLDPCVETESAWAPVQRFYLRRARRIMPLFYVTLAIVAGLGWMRPASGLYWHLSFLSNAYFIQQQRFVGAAGHLWAVAVEQQYYLVWPWIVLFLSRQRLREASLGLLGLGILTRVAAWKFGWSYLTIDIMTPAAFEALGIGAWLGAAADEEGPLSWKPWTVSGVGLAGLALAAMRWASHGTLTGVWLNLTTTELSRSLLLAWLIAWATIGIPGWMGRCLSSAPARALGRWSFAVYLSHNFVRMAAGRTITGLVPPPAVPFIALAATLALSCLAVQLEDALSRPERRMRYSFSA